MVVTLSGRPPIRGQATDRRSPPLADGRRIGICHPSMKTIKD
jgi:hypothetical protein